MQVMPADAKALKITPARRTPIGVARPPTRPALKTTPVDSTAPMKAAAATGGSRGRR